MDIELKALLEQLKANVQTLGKGNQVAVASHTSVPATSAGIPDI